jgi:hypothetical protein
MLKVNNVIGLTLRAAVLKYHPIYDLDSTAQRRCLAAHRLDLRVRHTLHWKCNLDRSRVLQECSSQAEFKLGSIRKQLHNSDLNTRDATRLLILTSDISYQVKS